MNRLFAFILFLSLSFSAFAAPEDQEMDKVVGAAKLAYDTCKNDDCKMDEGDRLAFMLITIIGLKRLQLRSVISPARGRVVMPIYQVREAVEDERVKKIREQLNSCTIIIKRTGCYLEEQDNLIKQLTDISDSTTKTINK